MKMEVVILYVFPVSLLHPSMRCITTACRQDHRSAECVCVCVSVLGHGKSYPFYVMTCQSRAGLNPMYRERGVHRYLVQKQMIDGHREQA